MLSEYESTLKNFVAERIGWHNPRSLSTEETSKYRETYLPLFHAVHKLDYKVAGVYEVLTQFREKARELQSEVQHTGDAAKAYVAKHGTFGHAELLMREHLPLDWAVAVIEYGEVIL